jgi:type III secretion protein U
MGEKTEKATPKKLRDARRKGQVAKSQDFPAAATFIVSLAATVAATASLNEQLSGYLISCFSLVTRPDLLDLLGPVFYQGLYLMCVASLPVIIATCLVGILVTFITTGPVFSPEVFKFDIKKFNPVDNLKGKFKMKTFVELIKSLLKIFIASIIVYTVVSSSISIILQTISMPLTSAAAVFNYFLWDVAVKVGLFFGAIAIFDLFYQKHAFDKEMMMEKFEIKQEYKDSEGNPEIKGKRKEMAREIAFSEGPAAGVARANAVVTNPTHLAIALGFDREVDPCPFVLAMGEGFNAEAIIKEAEKHQVPVVRNIRLAHDLWDNAKIYEYIPEITYEPVAEILRWIAELQQEEAVKAVRL